jgi:hypothetical protein
MNSNANQPQEWKPCDSGFLVAFANQTKSAQRRRVATRIGLGASVLLVAISLGVWSTGLWSSSEENYFGGIACHEVGENLPAMMAGTISGELRAKIEEHLRHCPRCQEAMRKMEAGHASIDGVRRRWTCECPQCQREYAQAIVNAATTKEPLGLLASAIDRPVAQAISGRN